MQTAIEVLTYLQHRLQMARSDMRKLEQFEGPSTEFVRQTVQISAVIRELQSCISHIKKKMKE